MAPDLLYLEGMRSHFIQVKRFVLPFVLVSIAACATSPTGRKQLKFMPSGQIDTMGVQSFQQMKAQTPIESDPTWNNYVKCIAIPITEVAKTYGGNVPKD